MVNSCWALICSQSSKSRRSFSFVCENISTFLSSACRLINHIQHHHPVNLAAYLINKWKITSKQNKTPTTHLYDSIILNGVIFAKPAKNSKCPASACNFYHATTKSEIHATAISFIYLSHSHQLYQLLSFGNDTNVGIWLTISALYWPPRWLGARKGIHPVSILLQLYPNIFLETFPGPLANPGKLEKWQFKTTNCVSNSFFFYSVIVFGTSTANSLNYLHLWLFPSHLLPSEQQRT